MTIKDVNLDALFENINTPNVLADYLYGDYLNFSTILLAL
jgi:hypothetical protein